MCTTARSRSGLHFSEWCVKLRCHSSVYNTQSVPSLLAQNKILEALAHHLSCLNLCASLMGMGTLYRPKPFPPQCLGTCSSICLVLASRDTYRTLSHFLWASAQMSPLLRILPVIIHPPLCCIPLPFPHSAGTSCSS